MCDNSCSFHELHKALCRALSDSGRIRKTADELAALQSNGERVTYAYELFREFQLFPRVTGEFKSEARSCEYRSKGNKLFKIKKDEMAMEMYTKSIAFAPKSLECLGMAFANRSAVLFEKKLYRECLNDIENAFKNDYPASLKEKLVKRRERATVLASQQLQIQYHSDLPKLGNPNRSIHCASSSVEIKTSLEMGRHVIASRDIPVGEVIAIEQPFATILLPAKTTDHCHHCLQLCYDLLPCEFCTEALFCTESCKEAAWDSYHKYECAIISILRKLDLSKLEHIALRIALIASRTNAGVSNLSESEVYHSGRYQEIHQLIANTECRNPADIFERSTTAAVMYQLVEAYTPFFVDFEAEESKGRFRELLLLHLQTGPSNFHEISELALSNGVYDSEETGAGAYAFLSLLNHSCNPNVVRHSYGTHVVLRALRPIRKGQQLFDNYGYHHALMSKPERQETLKKQYYFDCQCPACQEDWPLYKDLPAIGKDAKIADDVLEALRRGDLEVAKGTLEASIEKAERLEQFIPCVELANAQEIIKRCYALFANRKY